MAALSDPFTTLFTWFKAQLPTGAVLELVDDSFIDDLAEAGGSVKNRWFMQVRQIETSTNDLNTNRATVHLEVGGVWTTTKNLTWTNDIVNKIAAFARDIETTEPPSGVDLIQITERVDYADRFGLTVATVPVRALVHLED
jgi:hypothetical protein